MYDRRSLIVLLGLLLVISSSALGWDGRWELLSQAHYLGRLRDIDVGYNGTTRYIFAVDGNLNGHIWLSVNDGQNWIQRTSIPGHRFNRIAVQETGSRYGWALVPSEDGFSDAGAGPYLTTNYGNAWNLRPGDLGELETSKLLYALVADQRSTNLQIAFVGGDGNSQSGRHLFKTSNGGGEWDQITNGIPADPAAGNGMVSDIVIFPQDSRIMYLSLIADNSNKGIYKSIDNGESWVQMNDWFSPNAIAVAPDDETALVASNMAGDMWNPRSLVWHSNDSGNYWEIIYDSDYQGGYGRAICNSLEYGSNGVIYMAFANDDFPLQQQFIARWSTSSGFEFLPDPSYDPVGDKKAWSVKIDPQNSSNIYVGTEFTFYRSDNGGDNFEPRVDNTFNNLGANRVLSDLPYISFITDQPPLGSEYRSTNYGQNWAIRKSNGIVTSSFFSMDSGQEGLYFIGSTSSSDNGFIYRSLNSGSTWESPSNWPEAGFHGQINCLTADPAANSDWLYFGVNGADCGFYTSPDNCDTRIRHRYSLPQEDNPLDLAIDPSQASTILIADGSNGLYRTIDQGSTILPFGFSGSYVNRVRFCPWQPNIVLVATQSGLYKTTDINQLPPIWLNANPENYSNPIGDLEFNPVDNSVICFCSIEGGSSSFFISADTARSWIQVQDGLGNYVIHDLTVDIDYPDTFYAATDAGIYKLKNPVKSGVIPSFPTEQTWGPGTVIINGDVTVPPGVTLNINPGTQVLFVYNFDKHQTGTNTTRSELIVQGTLNAIGNENHYITFTSSRPVPHHEAGDWYGITFRENSNLTMRYCNVEYANAGVYGFSNLASGIPSNIQIGHCRFLHNLTAGIDLDRPSSQAMHIDSSYFEDCKYYGIRIRRDDITTIPACRLQADTTINCQNGIWYVGNSNSNYTKHPGIYSSILRYTLPSPTGYGIYVKSYSSPLAANIIQADSIVGFYAGIYLSNVNSNLYLYQNKVKYNTNYGLYLASASPTITNLQGVPDVFNWSQTGIFCDKFSSPYVRATKIKENSQYGVLIQRSSPPVSLPDFGTSLSPGGNSIQSVSGWLTYADMYYTGPGGPVRAVNNWWGETPPNPTQILGNVDYSNPRTSDPLPGLEKREAWYSDLPDNFRLRQNFPNPFNPSTTISFYLVQGGNTSIKIYNLNGQLIKNLVSGEQGIGEHTVIWDGKNESGQNVSSGVYFYVLSTDFGKTTQRMTLLR
jgi:hypothetical protein